MDHLTTLGLLDFLTILADRMPVHGDRLRELDAQMGDGDLGVTVVLGMKGIKDGLAGLKDRPRPGAPTRITEEQRQQVKTLVREGNNDGKHSWTVRALASEVGMSVGAVHKILHEDDAPAKPDSFLSPANILPVPQRDAFGLVGLFVNPPLNALALSVGPEPTATG